MDKSSFSIACTTCRARLKVRDLSLVGQILPCPKCGSMVMIATPEDGSPLTGGTRGGAARGPSETRPGGAFDHLDDALAAAAGTSASAAGSEPRWRTPTSIDPVPDETTTAHPDSSVDVPRNSDDGDAGAVDSSPEPNQAPVAPAKEAASAARIPDDWLTPRTASLTSVGMMVGGVIVGVVIALGVAGWILRSGSPPDMSNDGTVRTPDAASYESDPESMPEDPDATPSVTDGKSGVAGVENTRDDLSGRKTLDIVDKPDGAVLTKDDADANLGTPVPDPLAAVAQEARTDDRSEHVGALPNNDSNEAAEEAGRNSLAGSDVAPPRATPSQSSASRVPDATASDAQQTPADELSDFARWLQDTELASAKPIERAPDVTATATEPAEWQPDLPPMPSSRATPPSVDVAARLTDSISGLQFKQIPLHRALRTLTQLTTIPIRLDPLALGRNELVADTPVDLLVKDRTVAETLDSLLQPLNLSWKQTENGQLIVSSLDAQNPKLVTLRHDVSDLCGGDAQRLNVLARWIERAVAYGSWEGQDNAEPVLGHSGAMPKGRIEADADGKTLVLHHVDTVLYQVLHFCERLRIARQVPQQTKLPESQLSLGVPVQSFLHWDQPVSLRIWQDRNLAEVATAIEQQVGVTLLVDWPSLYAVGWSPQDGMKVFCEAQPLGELLRELLYQRGLGVRVWDDRTLEVTSLESLLAGHQIGFIALPKDSLGEAEVADLGATILKRLGAHRMQPEGDGAVLYDTMSGYLIASLSAPELEEVARLIQHWVASSRK